MGALPFLLIDDQREEADDDSIPPHRPNLVPLLWYAGRATSGGAELARFLTLVNEVAINPFSQ